MTIKVYVKAYFSNIAGEQISALCPDYTLTRPLKRKALDPALHILFTLIRLHLHTFYNLSRIKKKTNISFDQTLTAGRNYLRLYV